MIFKINLNDHSQKEIPVPEGWKVKNVLYADTYSVVLLLEKDLYFRSPAPEGTNVVAV